MPGTQATTPNGRLKRTEESAKNARPPARRSRRRRRRGRRSVFSRTALQVSTDARGAGARHRARMTSSAVSGYRVVIAGGGIAGLEALVALRLQAPELTRVTL